MDAKIIARYSCRSPLRCADLPKAGFLLHSAGHCRRDRATLHGAPTLQDRLLRMHARNS